MLANPFGEPDHRQAFAAALRVPDDAALAPPHVILRGLDAEVLIVPAEFLGARIEDDEVVNDFEEALLRAELAQTPIERILDRAGFLPREGVLFPRLDRAVAQPFGIVFSFDGTILVCLIEHVFIRKSFRYLFPVLKVDLFPLRHVSPKLDEGRVKISSFGKLGVNLTGQFVEASPHINYLFYLFHETPNIFIK